MRVDRAVTFTWFLDGEEVGSRVRLMKDGSKLEAVEAETDIYLSGFLKGSITKTLRIVVEFDPPVKPCA